ncbi:RICIN domain-containing protein [Kitasatospora purpeofusca]|uniref:RICIN domain-containing protein n=1 Tax=Kitasatospora purpeofusca TaxID=67352 RepID=UPI0036594930
MSITRKIAATVAGAIVLSGVTVFGAGSAAAAENATLAASTTFYAAAQNEWDNTNIANTGDTRVTTQIPSTSDSQTWSFNKVKETPEGTGIYTIRAYGTSKCITGQGTGNKVTLEPCNDALLTQQWVVDTGQEHTTIANLKNKNEVLKSNGAGTDATLEKTNGQPTKNELWTLDYRY